MTTKGSDSAYPNPRFSNVSGMTKREVFAKAALSGMDLQKSSPGGWTTEDDGKLAVEIADCTIAALNATEKEKSDG